jgi:hypothetical protein
MMMVAGEDVYEVPEFGKRKELGPDRIDIYQFILGHFPIADRDRCGDRVDDGEAKVRDGSPIFAKSGGIRETWKRLREYPKLAHSPPALISVFSNSWKSLDLRSC